MQATYPLISAVMSKYILFHYKTIIIACKMYPNILFLSTATSMETMTSFRRQMNDIMSGKACTTKSPLHLTALAAVSIVSIFLSPSSTVSCFCNAFTTPIQHVSSRTFDAPSSVVISMIPNDNDNNSNNNNENQAVLNTRRSILTSLTTATTTAAAILFSNELPAHAENETMERGGVKLTPFNSLAFNYRGTFSIYYIYLGVILVLFMLVLNVYFVHVM